MYNAFEAMLSASLTLMLSADSPLGDHSLLMLNAKPTLWDELGSPEDRQGGRLTHATQILAVHIDQIVAGLDAAVAGERAAPRQAAHHQAVHAPLLNVHLEAGFCGSGSA
jgi:hypothetical protein